MREEISKREQNLLWEILSETTKKELSEKYQTLTRVSYLDGSVKPIKRMYEYFFGSVNLLNGGKLRLIYDWDFSTLINNHQPIAQQISEDWSEVNLHIIKEIFRDLEIEYNDRKENPEDISICNMIMGFRLALMSIFGESIL